MLLRSISALLLGLMLTAVASAQEAAPSLQELMAQRNASFEKLQKMQSSFQAASPEDQLKIQTEFESLAKDLRERIFPGIEKTAPAALAAAPNDPVAQEAASDAMQFAYAQNRFGDTLKLSELLLKANPQDQLAANFTGVCKFANHDFTGAVAAFESAEKEELLIPELGGRYFDDARKYVDLWTKESAIRKQEDAPTDPKLQLPLVVLKTNRRDVTIEMLDNEAPNTVANFISLVENKFYDGLRFHRVIPGFMAQGGCPNSRDDAQGVPGTGGPGYNIDCECAAENARMHFAGSLSMAHAGKNTGGSQFFLTHLPTSHLNGVHTVFGRVISGLDVVRSIQPNDQIITATVTRKRDHEYKPVTHPEAD